MRRSGSGRSLISGSWPTAGKAGWEAGDDFSAYMGGATSPAMRNTVSTNEQSRRAFTADSNPGIDMRASLKKGL
jgi:hypothetical protein